MAVPLASITPVDDGTHVTGQLTQESPTDSDEAPPIPTTPLPISQSSHTRSQAAFLKELNMHHSGMQQRGRASQRGPIGGRGGRRRKDTSPELRRPVPDPRAHAATNDAANDAAIDAANNYAPLPPNVFKKQGEYQAIPDTLIRSNRNNVKSTTTTTTNAKTTSHHQPPVLILPPRPDSDSESEHKETKTPPQKPEKNRKRF